MSITTQVGAGIDKVDASAHQVPTAADYEFDGMLDPDHGALTSDRSRLGLLTELKFRRQEV